MVALIALLATACAPVDEPGEALPHLQDVVNGEQPDDVKHRHWWKSPGYAMFGGH